MDTKANLENELVSEVSELSNVEEKETKIKSSIYINDYEELREQKITSFKNSINDQISFYCGKNSYRYVKQVDRLTEKYEKLVNSLIREYNTRYIAVNNELQDTQSNQKITIVNIKFGIRHNDNIKIEASQNKKENYEIILEECSRQLDACRDEMVKKVNEIFYNKENQLAINKFNIIERIKNFFTGNAKVEKFLLKPLEVELEQLEKSVSTELEDVSKQTIYNLAIIKDARINTQKIYNEMLKEHK